MSEQTKTIFKLALKGKSSSEIQAALGVSEGTVSGALSRGRAAGHIPPKAKKTAIDRLHNSNINRGKIGDIISGLDLEQNEWLVKTTIDLKCESIAEFILEIVRDEYFEQTQS
jgi:hypothetical protein